MLRIGTGHGGPGWRARHVWLRVAVIVVVALVFGLALSRASSADTPNIQIVKQTMEGTLKVVPGDYIAAGYVFRVQKPHPTMAVVIRNAQVELGFRCDGSSTRVWTAKIPLQPTSMLPANSPYASVDGRGARLFTIAQDDDQWRPTKDTNEADGFQGAVSVPPLNLCPPGKLLVNDGASGGATFTAEVWGSNTTSTVEIKFHYRIPDAKNYPNLDCSNQYPAGYIANPSPGISACTAKWSPTANLKARAIPDLNNPLNDVTFGPRVDGTVFKDVNANGQREASELGLGGALIQVYDANTNVLIQSVTTTAPYEPTNVYNGYFAFALPVAGQYKIVETDPSGYVSTTPNVVYVDVPFEGGPTVNFGERTP